MRKARRLIKCTSAVILISCMLSGCKEVSEVPKLIEPLAQSESFRPAGRHTIGKLSVEIGNAVPMEYCHSYKKVTTIKNICVDVGQYVHKGDILATADIEKLSDELADLESERALCISKEQIGAPIYSYNKEILELEMTGAKNASDHILEAQLATELQTEEENHIYDEKLYNYTVSKYDKKIADISTQISDGSLRAKCDGYVTYIKDTSMSNTAAIGESVVTLADFDDLHIEVPSLTTFNYIYKDYPVRYAVIDGREVPIRELEYTATELIYARAQEASPNIRFLPEDSTPLTLGESVLLFFVKDGIKDTLCVGNDSINTDEDGTYVYVKSRDGSGKEKRYVNAGKDDEYYTQILSGLSEGEEVYYSQDSACPVKYSEYVAECSNYSEPASTKQFSKAQINNTAFFASCEGTITDIPVAEGDSVKAGDTIMIIDTGGGSAEIADNNTEIKHLEIDLNKNLYDHDRNIWDYNERIDTIKKECGEEVLVTPEYVRQAKIYENKIKIEEIEKAQDNAEYESNRATVGRRLSRLQKDNDGQGRITVKAENDGIITKLYVHKGSVIDKSGNNRLLASMTTEAPGKAMLAMSRSGDVAPLGAKITITEAKADNTTEKHYGTCISNAWNNKCYAYTENGKAYISRVIKDSEARDFAVIALEEEDLFDNIELKDCTVTVDRINADGLIVLPGSLVYSEESKNTTLVKHYVWKIQNNTLVKEYIIPGSDYDIGNDSNVVVMMGVNPGDILARE